MTSATTSNNNQYFDLITIGVGFINRPRNINAKGKPLALTFVASYGDANEKNRVTYELYVRGSDAKEIIQKLADSHNDSDKIWAKLELGDTRPELVLDDSGNPMKRKDGSFVLINRGNLLKVHFLKKNGDILFQTTKQAEVPTESAASDDSSNEVSSDTVEPVVSTDSNTSDNASNEVPSDVAKPAEANA